MKKVIFIDAQQMKKEHPETFYAPTQEELDKIKIRDYAKVCVGRERFWVKVLKIEDETITGTIDNDLVFTHEHGLKFDDVISFEKKNIYSIS
jgi:hypothetical protein